MGKHTIEVEVPDGWEYDLQRVMQCTEYKFEEMWGPSIPKRIMVEIPLTAVPVWQYPEWLGGAGVAMDESGEWHLLGPKHGLVLGTSPGLWSGGGAKGGKLLLTTERFPLWSPPPCTDWRESWHPNPRWEG